MDTIDAELAGMLAKVSTASITSQLIKRGLRTRAIANVAPVNPETPRMFGIAHTLRYIPMREDLATGALMAAPDHPQRRAIETARAGSVLVVDTHGCDVSGTFGDILIARMRVRGLAGVLSDGPMRDVSELRRMPFPVFARGNAAPPSYASMLAVDAQVPISCGGVAVFPGDVVLGDADGAVVIPPALARDVVADALEQDRIEAFIRRQVEGGASIIGTYPPTDETRAAYRAWLKTQE